MSGVKSFNPVLDTLLIGGIQVTGYAESKFTITPTNNRATTTQGIDGDISVNVDSRYSGTLTVNLLQNSDTCRVLDAMILSQSITGSTPFFLVSVECPSSAMSLATTGWIEQQAEFETSQETGTRSYTLGLADTRFSPAAELVIPESIGTVLNGLGTF